MTDKLPTPDRWLNICEAACMLPDSVFTDEQIVEMARMRRSAFSLEDVATARAEHEAYLLIPVATTSYRINLRTGELKRLK